MKTLVIAEIGSAWRFGKHHLNNAYRAVDTAKKSGADIVKFQWCSNPRTMEQRRNVSEGTYDIVAWPQEWISMIAAHAQHKDIEFLCTVFLPEDVPIMNPYVQRWKVASLENGAIDLLAAMSKTKKEVFLSYGCHNGKSKQRIWEKPLHCTAAYPAPLDELNLLAIRQGNYVGYSDHSADLLTGALAVACGATIIEVHFKLEKTPKDNPDYLHSHFPRMLKWYIDDIRKAERILGNGVKRVMPSEAWAIQHQVRT